MRILYASMMLPYPPTFGKRMEIWSCLRALAAEGHVVPLVSFSDTGQCDIDEHALSDVCRHVDLVPLHLSGKTWRAYLGRLAALPTVVPFDAWLFRSSRFRNCLER